MTAGRLVPTEPEFMPMPSVDEHEPAKRRETAKFKHLGSAQLTALLSK